MNVSHNINGKQSVLQHKKKKLQKIEIHDFVPTGINSCKQQSNCILFCCNTLLVKSNFIIFLIRVGTSPMPCVGTGVIPAENVGLDRKKKKRQTQSDHVAERD